MKQSNEPNNSNNWFDLPEPTMRWLVHGLITSDDNTGFIGKPKSGKSTGIRNLTAAIIMGTKFLGRDIALAPHTGRVLYLHIDRKDRPHQVAAELRNLGITRDHKDRLLLLTEQDIPKNSTFEQRCAWLAEHVKEFQPHLVVIDLLLQFVKTKKGVNDYDSMIEAVAYLQDRLNEVNYKGALLVSLHARKAVSEDPGDSLLGSTGIRGSLSTGLYFRQYKRQKCYTVQSDQTHRDATLGELDETLVNRDSGTGVITLGAKFDDLKHEEKKDEWELRRQKVFGHITRNEGRTADELATELSMAKKTILPLVEAMESGKLIYASGEGKKGDPKKYFATKVIVGKPLVEAPVTPALKKCEYEGCNNTASNAISTAWQGEYCGHEHWRAAQSGVGVQSCIQ